MLFYETGNADSLAKVLADLLENSTLQQQMAEQNFSVAVRMTMERVVGQYLQSFAKALTLKRRNKPSKRLPVRTVEIWPVQAPQATEAMQTMTPR
jgi:hypothetical protein